MSCHELGINLLLEETALKSPVVNKKVIASIKDELVKEKSIDWIKIGNKILIENCSNGDINIK